jgi:SulP family sulfate permease
VAIVVGSALVPIFSLDVARLADIVEVPAALPLPAFPDLTLIPALLLPAVSLAFVGLIQGAAISASLPNDDGTYPNADQDFIGQGAANLVSGLFQGMPVGGSMSATMISRSAGGRSRMAQVVAAVVMAVGILLFAPLVEQIAMPSLAGLLVVVGVRTVKPNDLTAVWRTGRLQAVALTTTFVLTILIPLQYAVLVGVGVAMVLTIARQSDQMELRRLVQSEDGIREEAPPAQLPAGEVVILQPYGSLFFATASAFEDQLPKVEGPSRSVVIVRLRGRTELGSTLAEVLGRYGLELNAAGGRLFVVCGTERVRRQLEVAGVIDEIGEDAFYVSSEWLGRTVRRAAADAQAWIDEEA